MLKHAAAKVPQRGVGPCLNQLGQRKTRKRGSRFLKLTRNPKSSKIRLLNSFVNQMVASAFEIKGDLLLQSDRGEARISRARQISMYLMNTSLSQTFVEVAEFYGRDRTTVSHACSVVEELRDVAEFDARLSELELTISTVLALIKTGEELAS